MKVTPLITRDILLHLFRYDRENGVLYWENPPKGKSNLKGRKAGSIQRRNHTNYWFIKIRGVPRCAHRLIWCIETGSYPKNTIDHLDNNGLNNRFSNLKDKTVRENAWNRKVHRNGKLPGCYWCKQRKKWRTQCTIAGERMCLGHFDTEFEAHNRYIAELKARGLYL